MEFQVTKYLHAPKKNDSTNRNVSDICVVQWNIERGTELDKILHHLKRIDADILILQELDVNCSRSNCIDVPRKIAQELQLNGVFVPEFEELDCPTRSPLNAVGSRARNAKHVLSSPLERARPPKGATCAHHGNAIFTKFEIADHDVIAHEDGIDWEVEGVRLAEPRLGKRVSLAMKIKIPTATEKNDDDDDDGPTTTAKAAATTTKRPQNRFVWCYSVHTEVFAGAAVRVKTYYDVLEHAELVTGTGEGARQPSANSACGVIIGGDLNTVVSGIVRFSRNVGNDRLKALLPFWLSEAQIFDYLAFSENKSGLGVLISSWAIGIEQKVLKLFNKNVLGLCDPFDVNKDITLDHPTYRRFGRSFVAYKLDWLIASSKETALGFQKKASLLLLLPVEKSKEIFNHDFKASDHKGLVVRYEIRSALENVSSLQAAQDVAEREWRNDESRRDIPLQFVAYFVILGSWCVFLLIALVKYVKG